MALTPSAYGHHKQHCLHICMADMEQHTIHDQFAVCTRGQVFPRATTTTLDATSNRKESTGIEVMTKEVKISCRHSMLLRRRLKLPRMTMRLAHMSRSRLQHPHRPRMWYAKLFVTYICCM